MIVQTLRLISPFLFLILFSTTANALTLFDSLGKAINLKEHKGLIVSDFCVINSKKNCQALEFAKEKYKKNLSISDSGKLSMANPASVYCELLDGKSITLKDQQGNAHAYCQFKDSSLIDAWSLYRSHFNTDSK